MLSSSMPLSYFLSAILQLWVFSWWSWENVAEYELLVKDFLWVVCLKDCGQAKARWKAARQVLQSYGWDAVSRDTSDTTACNQYRTDERRDEILKAKWKEHEIK